MKAIIIIFAIIILGIVYYSFIQPALVEKRCRTHAVQETNGGAIGGPDAIGNSIERCLANHGMDINM